MYELLMNTTQNDIIPAGVRVRINYYFNFLGFIRVYYTYVRPFYIVWQFVEPFLLFFGSEIGCNLLKYKYFTI